MNSSPSEYLPRPDSTLVVSGPGGSGPHLTVSGSDVLISWTEKDEQGTAELLFSRWNGGSWSSPTSIASGSNWFVNWADVPSVTISESGKLIAHWLEKTGESTYAYGVRITSSADGGATWSEPVWLHDDLSETEHGFAVLEPVEDNAVVGVWLDGRKYATGENEMSLISRTVLPDGSLTNEDVIDDLVCDCCPVSSASKDGRVLVVYRNRTSDEIRDIYALFFDGNEWDEPTNVHSDNWMIGGCPVNGPAVDMTRDESIVAWFTAAQDSPRVLTTFGSDSGTSWSPPVRVDLGNPVGRADVAIEDSDDGLVLWMENSEDGSADILLRRVGRAEVFEPVHVASVPAKRGSGMPRVIRLESSLIVAWVDVENDSRIVSREMPLTSVPR